MPRYKQKMMQHLGIVAGICNEIGLIEKIDNVIPKSKRTVSIGQAVQSMVLNALGFTGRAMYLHPEFYEKRPVELLVGDGLTADDLNGDCLGSALYTEDNLKELQDISWVTRVPESIKAAKDSILECRREDMISSACKGYSYKEIHQEYGGIKQRWLIVFSQSAYEREYDTLVKNIRKESDKKGKEVWHLGNKAFACEADAIKAAKAFDKKLKYHTLQYTIEVKQRHEKKGRPGKGQEPIAQDWYISGSLVINPVAVKAAKERKGFFIIATNETDPKKISAEKLLSVYKAQGTSIERGFRFLKDPMFYAESLYLKRPDRIMALIMVMGLSLLIYSLAERKLRKVLDETNQTVLNQKKKPTGRPTIRWVFQKFESVLMLYIYENDKLKEIILELNTDQKTIIRCLGRHVEKMYFFDF